MKKCSTPIVPQVERNSVCNDPTSLIDSLSNFSLRSNNSSPNTEVPMEIDSSGNLSPTSELEHVPKVVKLRQRLNKSTPVKDTDYKTEAKTLLYQCPERRQSYFCIVLLSFIVLLSIVIVGNVFFICTNKEIQLDSIKQDLRAVTYQTSAVKIIIDTLEHIRLWHKPVKVLPFIGSSGVGKTFTANILKRNFQTSLVHEINNHNLKDAKKQNEIFDNLSKTSCNLIIVEDLYASDCNVLVDFIVRLPVGRTVLVIAIFNVQSTVDGWSYEIQTQDYEIIRNSFDESGLYYDLVYFNVLKVEVLEEWLRQELYKRNIESDRHSQLIQRLISADQVERMGFKGINTKLLVALGNVH